MDSTRNTTAIEKAFRSAFWRIAKSYSGAAPRDETPAKLVRGLRFINSLTAHK